MDKQLFEGIVYDLQENIEKKAIQTKNFHLDYNSSTMKHINKENVNYTCQDKAVRSQIVSLINSGIGMYLGSTLNKLNSDTLKAHNDPYDQFKYDPKEVADDLLRYCELNRDTNINLLTHKTSGNAYGAVSDNHQIVQDAKIYELYKNTFVESGIPHTANFSHDYFKMKIDITLDDVYIELEEGNSMKLRISLGNSMFGFGSAFVRIGSWEQVCSNGAMGWSSKLSKTFNLNEVDKKYFPLQKRHVYAPSFIIQEMETGIMKNLSLGQKYMEVLEAAHETNIELFKKTAKIEEELTKQRFGLAKAEAADVYKLLIHKHKQYKRKNAFDVGRAIAEVARDTISLDRRIELETIAGKVMLSQVA